MTRRERVITALNHKEQDKIPVDCGGMRSTGLMAMTYNMLKGHLGIKKEIEVILKMLQKYINFLKRKLYHFSMMAIMKEYLSNG